MARMMTKAVMLRSGLGLSLLFALGIFQLPGMHLVHGAPLFTWGSATSVPGIGSMAMADFNGDGHLDVAAAVNGAGFGVQILLSQGNGMFQSATTIVLTGTAPTNIATADLDSDGDADIVVGTSSMTFAGLVPGDLNFIYNQGNGTFSAPTAYPFGNLISGIDHADFNGDAISDIVTINGVLGQMFVLMGNGIGGFGAPNTLNLPTSDMGVVQVASDDINSDGHADLIVPCPLMDVVAIFYGNGLGGFTSALSYPGGPDPKRVDFGDLNGDGLIDMVITNWVANQATVLLQDINGFSIAGTLQYPGVTPNPTGNSIWADVLVFDFDQDGVKDVAIPGYQALVTFAGVGDGTFHPPATWAMAGEWSQLKLADVNSDGLADVIGLNWVQDTVDVMINAAGPVEVFRRGDVNRNGALAIDDAIALLAHLFVPNPTPVPCLDAADLDDSGTLELADAIDLLSYLFVSGSSVPPAPGPLACGVDPTSDSLAACGMDPCP